MVVVEVLVCRIEARNMTRVFPIIRDAVGLYGDAASHLQIPSGTENSR